MDAVRRKIADTIAEAGWAVIMVGPDSDSPPFAYSVGLLETFQHPEILMVGFDPELMRGIINAAGRWLRKGARFQDGATADQIAEGYLVAFRAVPSEKARLWARAASERSRPKPFSLLQLFLPDVAGKFPWDASCDPQFRKFQSAILGAAAAPTTA